MLRVFGILILLSSILTIDCAASARKDLPSVVRYISDSALPVVVPAESTTVATTKPNARETTANKHTSIITFTNVIFTTTTVSVTTKQDSTSPTNALQVLSAAERSFSLAQSIGGLPNIVTRSFDDVSPSAIGSVGTAPSSLSLTMATSNPYNRASTGRRTKEGQNTTFSSESDPLTVPSSAISTPAPSSRRMMPPNHSGMESGHRISSKASTDAAPVSSAVTEATTRALTASNVDGSSKTSSSSPAAIWGNGTPTGTFTASNAASTILQSNASPKLALMAMSIVLLAI